ncbi:MAG: hypothetical protein KJ799_09475, partial [Bacteroidetes bacterium]|nr:hypothetical protein [Bacteroidota bacterium]
MVILFLYQSKIPADLEFTSSSVVDTLVFEFLFIAVGVYSGFLIFPKIFLKKGNINKHLAVVFMDQNNQILEDPVLKLIGLDRTMMIIRLAMLEGVTLFALVILIKSVLEGNN